MGFNIASLPDSFRKCIAKEDRERTPEFKTSDELADKQAVKAEKEMHVLFEQWCSLNGLFVIHARTDRATTYRKGIPDFVVIGRGGKSVSIEFKHGANKVTTEQQECINELCALEAPVLVSNDLREAIKWTKEQLEK